MTCASLSLPWRSLLSRLWRNKPRFFHLLVWPLGTKGDTEEKQ